MASWRESSGRPCDLPAVCASAHRTTGSPAWIMVPSPQPAKSAIKANRPGPRRQRTRGRASGSTVEITRSRATLRATPKRPSASSSRSWPTTVASSFAAPELDRLIGAWSRERTKFEATELLQRAGVPAGPVLQADEILADEQLAAREFFDPIAVNDLGTVPIQRYVVANFGRLRLRPGE